MTDDKDSAHRETDAHEDAAQSDAANDEKVDVASRDGMGTSDPPGYYAVRAGPPNSAKNEGKNK